MCGPLMQESAISQTSGVNLPVQNRKTRYIREVLLVSAVLNLLQRGIVNTEINSYFNSLTKFSLNNRQPSKALKFSRQPSKLEKITVNRQSYRPIGY